MIDQPTIYQVAHMMTSEEHITKDFQEIMDGLKDMIYNKYIGTLQAVVQDQYKSSKKNPTREVRLLEAAKPFVESTQHSKIDKWIDTMHAIRTVQSLRQDLQEYWLPGAQSINAMEHADGVYEIDEACMRGKVMGTGNSRGDMIMLLAIFLVWKEI
ncbi:MAG: hypothetical protein GX962_03645 [Epulopiscium sp.]|nr:hypothetical protein [Candidatus Epulonipiscium sp.]